uniref:(northern house mosquito) hypothetical protein n=1 Tax=Culex pipiens TaxID=7175 RepID=A0A8D8J0W2_CULPI
MATATTGSGTIMATMGMVGRGSRSFAILTATGETTTRTGTTTTGTRMGFATVAVGVMDFLTSRIIIISAITLALAMVITTTDRRRRQQFVGEGGDVPVPEPPERQLRQLREEQTLD